MKNVVGILGVGEVGEAVVKVFKKKFTVLRRDVEYDEIKNSKIDVLHICIPYSDKFEKLVLGQIDKNHPELVVIHSTVKPGTTKEIFKKSKKPVVHSPVMGTHPNLAQDLLLFTKIIGPSSNKAAQLAEKHFNSVGIRTATFKSPDESEIAKLLDTTYYGWNIIFSKIVWEICKKSKVDFENVYTKLNQIYNDGYRKSRPNVMRPILKYQSGTIGGHCIIPNAGILKSYLNDQISEFLLAENRKLQKS